MKRCFISIDIPEEIKKEIQKTQNQIPELQGKYTEAKNLHLTLKFLGEISDEQLEQVRKRLRGIKFKIFEIQIDSLGFFSEDFIRIIWIHLSDCDGLQKKVDDTLDDLFPKEKRFMSHLTIARVRNVEDKEDFLKKLNKIKIPKIKFVVDRFQLKESILKSDGPNYRTIEEYFSEKKKI